MTVSSVSSSTSATKSPIQHQSLGQGDFIRLMTTQMKLQDPTDPVDNKEMIAQMAQFSSLSGIENMNTSLKTISQQLDRLIAQQNAAPSTKTAA